MFDPTLVATFIRTLGTVGTLIGQPGVAVIANAAATFLTAGADGWKQFAALTAEIKARQEAGVTTTAEEILADVARIKALDDQIQRA